MRYDHGAGSSRGAARRGFPAVVLAGLLGARLSRHRPGRARLAARPRRRRAPLVALLVLGPLIWGAVLAQNDLHDLPSDRVNPRKATAPLVTGAVSAGRLRIWYR